MISKKNLVILIGFLVVTNSLSGESQDPLLTNCESKQEYKTVCDTLTPTSKCSKPLTDLCCECEESWGISYSYCGFTPNLLPTPTPTPTLAPPTPTPTLSGGGDIPDASECLNGSDGNFDGLVDGTSTPCLYVDGCKKDDLEIQKDEIELNAGKLEKLSLQAYKLLKAAPKKALKFDKDLSERLAESGKNVLKQLPKKIKAAKLQLELIKSLPEEIVVCSDTSSCKEVDHSASIKSYRQAVVNLRALATRSLRRATRLIEDNVKIAALKTNKFGKDIRKQANLLIAQADALPKKQSVCEGGD